MILFFVVTFLAFLFLKPEWFGSEGSKVRIEIDKFLYKISGGQFTLGGGMWGEMARLQGMENASTGDENGTMKTGSEELPVVNGSICPDKFGTDFDYLSATNNVSYGGESPEVAYTNGFQSACKAAAQSGKQWKDTQSKSAETGISSTVSMKQQMYVDLIQGACTDAESKRISSNYSETKHIEDYVRGQKDACIAITGETY